MAACRINLRFKKDLKVFYLFFGIKPIQPRPEIDFPGGIWYPYKGLLWVFMPTEY